MKENQEVNLLETEESYLNEDVFDVSKIKYDPEKDYSKQLHWLKRYIIESFRKAKYTNKQAKDYATRFAQKILDKAKNKN